MNKVSGLRKFGVVARVAGEQAGRNRVLSAVMGAVRTTGRSFGRAAHQLWLEVTGLIFLVMSLSFAAAAVKEYEKYHAHEAASSRLAIASSDRAASSASRSCAQPRSTAKSMEPKARRAETSAMARAAASPRTLSIRASTG